MEILDTEDQEEEYTITMTYTMEGTEINKRSLKCLFEDTAGRTDWQYTITVSGIEIYNDMIKDLLGDDTSFKLEVKMNPDSGYYTPEARQIRVKSVSEVNEVNIFTATTDKPLRKRLISLRDQHLQQQK